MPPTKRRTGGILKKKTAEEAKATPGVEGGLLQRRISGTSSERKSSSSITDENRVSVGLTSLKDVDPNHDLRVHEHDLRIERDGRYSHAGAGMFSTGDADEGDLAGIGESVHATDAGEVLHHKHIPTLSGLPLPCGLRPSPLGGVDKIMEDTDTDTFIAHKLAGLPGKLQLGRGQTRKYFGNPSREEFYKRFHWVNKQRDKTFKSAEEKSKGMDEFIFDNEMNHINHASVSYAFAPVRPERMTRKEDHVKHIHSKLEKLDEKSKAIERFEYQMKERDERLNRAKTKLKKNITGDPKLDRKLLAKVQGDYQHDVDNITKQYESKLLELATEDDVFSVADSQVTTTFIDTNEISRLTLGNHEGHELEDGKIDIHDDRDKESMGLPASPRTMYIDGCIRSNLNPRPSIILRKTLTKEMNLQHYSMGDEMGKLLASSLRELPFIQSINLSNNKLTDESLGPILGAIMGIPNILSLDFSDNVTGPIFAQLLAEFLGKNDCSLIKLTLKNADVDDYECTNFVNALKKNNSLRELDLSNNLIGSAENLNTVMPDLITGGEAFADYLDEETCKLESLKLVWNMIRLGGAIDFCNSLIYNDSLTLLDVSFNALSHEGGLTIGNALLSNKKLKTLSLCNNNIDARAAFTICTAIMENHTLRVVHLDGNPIGKAGASALMRVAVTVGGRTKVTADRCNITMRDSKAWYDYNTPLMKYQLDMTLPYERAILLNLLHLIATHPSYEFRYINYDQNATKSKVAQNPKEYQSIDMKNRGIPVDLVQLVVASNEDLLDEYERETVKKLKALKEAASDIFIATKLFQEVDVDGGGELDVEEFALLLTKVGIEVDATRMQETMEVYDTDGGGTIGMVEFLMFLRTQLAEANDRLSDFLDSPVMSIRDSGKKYIPPKEGKIYLEVIDSFKTKDIYKKMTAHDRAKMVEAAKTSTDTTGMINLAVPCFKMRMQEGINTFDNMIAEGGEKVKVAAKILLQLNDANESLKFLNRTLKDDPKDWKALKAELGNAIKPILGYPNGYYEIDLTNEIDIFTFVRLCELSETMKDQKFQDSPLGVGVVGDISQKGNWTCFRNETMIVKEEDEETEEIIEKSEFVEINADFARELPKSGLLKFDFSTSSRPNRLEIQLSDVKLVKFMVYHKLITIVDQMHVLDILKDLDKYCRRHATISPKGIYSCPKAKSGEVGKAVDEFYDNLNCRRDELEVGKKKEEVNVVLDDAKVDSNGKNQTTSASSGSFMKRERGQNLLVLNKTAQMKQKYTSYKASFKPKITKLYDSDDEDEEEDEDEVHDGKGGEDDDIDGDPASISDDDDDDDDDNGGLTKIEIERKLANLTYSVEPKRDELSKKLHTLYTSDEVSPEAKGTRMVEVLIDFLAKHHFMCRHIAVIIAYFDYGSVKKSEHFGSYNVELVVSMFSRIMDPHNFEVIAHQLNGYELGCIYARLGYLTLFNPLKPEGAWELNIGRREERMTAKVLCLLSTNEPGRNWIGETFRWERYKEGMPGWELTNSWMSEQTMPDRGILHCTYYSGEGKGKKKCKINENYRYSLMGLFLVSEQEILDQDSDRLNEPMRIEDSRCYKYMKMLSATYFTYLLNNSQLKKITYFVPKAASRKKKGKKDPTSNKE